MKLWGIWLLKLTILSAVAASCQSLDCEGSSLNKARSSSEAASCCKNSLTAFGTVTFANSGFYAQSSASRLYLFGIRYNKLLARKHLFAVSYTPELISLGLLSQSAQRSVLTTAGFTPPKPAQLSFGAGLSPVGIELSLTRHQALQFFIATHAGFLFFNENEPSSLAAQFNFALDGEAGLRIPLKRQKAITVSYRFHHFSNGFTARDNPGVDSQMLTFGYTFVSWPQSGRKHGATSRPP